MALGAVALQSSVTTAAAGAPGATSTTRQIAKSGTASVTSGSPDLSASVQAPETLSAAEGALAPNRSHGTGTTSVGAISQPKPVTLSHPELLASFDGLITFSSASDQPRVRISLALSHPIRDCASAATATAVP